MTTDRPLSILIITDLASLSAFVSALASMLANELPAHVGLQLRASGKNPATSALDTLLSLEKLIIRRGRPCWTDRIDPSSVRNLTGNIEAPFSLIIDLTSDVQEHALPVLRPMFNGGLGEQALASNLFFSETPRIQITFQPTASDPPLSLCEGTASLEAAQGIGGAMEAVWSRTAMLMIKAIRAGISEGRADQLARPALSSLSMPAVVRYSASAVAKAAAQKAYALCCHRGHWRIGWRCANATTDLWSRRSLAGTQWNILRDPIDHFYADPFPVFWRGKDYILFEDLNHKTGKGIISAVEFGSDGQPGPAIPVLEEPWHLSYPFIIQAEGQIWMVPEASLSGQITLYRATTFPWSWERHSVLVSGIEAADATIVKHGDRFWMFAVVRGGIGGYSDTLALWSADRLLGDWQEHIGNPVLIDDRSARPAGAMVLRNGHLMRPVQDCRYGYGAGLSLARVTTLSETVFEQVVETRLTSGTKAWPGRKIHTLNGNGRLETIDGSIIRPKLSVAAKVADSLYRPR